MGWATNAGVSASSETTTGRAIDVDWVAVGVVSVTVLAREGVLDLVASGLVDSSVVAGVANAFSDTTDLLTSCSWDGLWVVCSWVRAWNEVLAVLTSQAAAVSAVGTCVVRT